jgi:hypothetical protein
MEIQPPVPNALSSIQTMAYNGTDVIRIFVVQRRVLPLTGF